MFHQSHNVFWSTRSFFISESNAWPEKHIKLLWYAQWQISASTKPQNVCIGCWLTQPGICMFIKPIVSLLNCIFIKMYYDFGIKWLYVLLWWNELIFRGELVKLNCFISGAELAEVVRGKLAKGHNFQTLSFKYLLMSGKMWICV